MAQYRQSGFNRGAPAWTILDFPAADHVPIAVPHKQTRHHHRKLGGGPRISIPIVVCLLLVTTFGFIFISTRDHTENNTSNVKDDDFRNDFLTNVTRISNSQVSFGHASVTRGTNHHGLYNEEGRNELKTYEEKYEASLKNIGQSGYKVEDGRNSDIDNEEIDIDEEYDDGIDLHDARTDDYDSAQQENEMQSELPKSHSDNGGDNSKAHYIRDVLVEGSAEDSPSKLRASDKTDRQVRVATRQSKSSSEKHSTKHGRHHKFSSAKCEMQLLNSTAQLVDPMENRKFARFSLLYTDREARLDGADQWEPKFAGHQSLREREDSFFARDKKINCGFIKGPEGYSSTGFDLAVNDVQFLSRCHLAVVSCIFGNSDRLRSPFNKMVSRISRKNVCFVMFMDEATLQTLSSEGQMPDKTGFVGLWKVVVVKNLPFPDMRRVGKIPKLLSHRLFPSARYSIWLDSKLRLQRDPILLLEYFLWRKGHEYAISNHYDRHCVWEEVERNKKLNKYNHKMIDQQFAFYRADGLKRFNASDPEKLLPSNVPEGSLIIRAHTPMSNLLSCLWFNEVDRFTPRDQLSFAYTYHKLRKTNPNKPFYFNMFKDCERRQITKLFRHRTEEKRILTQTAVE